MSQTEEEKKKEKALKVIIENLAECAEETFQMVSNLEGRSIGLLEYCNFGIRLNDLRIQPYNEIKQLIRETRENLGKAIEKISEKKESP